MLISSSNVRYEARDRVRMKKLRNTSSDVELSTLDGGEEVEHGESFFKGGTLTGMHNSVDNNVGT